MSDFAINNGYGSDPGAFVGYYNDIPIGNDERNMSGEIKLSYPLTPNQKIMLKANYDTTSFDGDGYNTGRCNSVTLAALQYQLLTSIGKKMSNSLTVGGGFLSHRVEDYGTYKVSAGNPINSAIFGAANNLSFLIFNNEMISFAGHSRVSGMGLNASPSHLDYGMKPTNWDNYGVNSGVSLEIKPLSFATITQKYAYSFEKYNPNLYFFLDSCDKNELTTILDFKIAAQKSIAIDHALQSYRDNEDKKLVSNVALTLKLNNLALSGETEHNYLDGQVNNHGANLRYVYGEGEDPRIAFDVGWENKTYKKKSINQQISLGVSAAIGRYAESMPQRDLDNNSGLDFPVNDNISFAQACEHLNSIKKVKSFFYNNIYYAEGGVQTIFNGDSYDYLSPEEVFQSGKGVCSDQALAQAALLVENGYANSYVLGFGSFGAPYGHAIAMTFDPDSKEWYSLEYGTCYRLAVKNQQSLSAEEAAAAILLARGDKYDYLCLFNPPQGFLYQGLNDRDTFKAYKDHYVINYKSNSLFEDNSVKLIPEMGAKSYIGDKFWE